MDFVLTVEIYFGTNVRKWSAVFKMVAIAWIKISIFVAVLQNYYRYCWATSLIMYWGDETKLYYIMGIRVILKYNQGISMGVSVVL